MTAAATNARRKRSRRWVRRSRRKVASVLLPLFGPSLLRYLSGTWKMEVLGQEHFDEAFEADGRLATLWNGRMLLPLPTYHGRGIQVLVSPSADGSLVPGVLKRFGYSAIRGSSNKNPARALREMRSELLRGGTIVITPDGPRGPRHRVNPGPAWMSKETGYPILPVGCACTKAWRLNSWDHFTIPKPGAGVAIAYGQPIWVPKDADDEVIARETERMRVSMMDAEKRAFEHLGTEPDW